MQEGAGTRASYVRVQHFIWIYRHYNIKRLNCGAGTGTVDTAYINSPGKPFMPSLSSRAQRMEKIISQES